MWVSLSEAVFWEASVGSLTTRTEPIRSAQNGIGTEKTRSAPLIHMDGIVAVSDFGRQRSESQRRPIAPPWFPVEQRLRWKVSGAGYGIHWPDIDEDLSTEGLLRGAPAAAEPARLGR